METNPKTEISFESLRSANTKRNDEVFGPCNDWTLMEWGCAMAGEAGEVCGALKKMRRMVEGTNSAKDPSTMKEYQLKVADEIADVIIYLDLIGSKLNIDLGECVRNKFNEVSDRMKATVYL